MAERKLTIRMDADTANLQRGMKTASTSTQSFGKSIQSGITRHAAGIRMTGIAIAGLGAAMTAMAVLSVKAAADFGAELANVSTMLDDIAMHLMPEYSDQLREMSKDFGESTKTLSKGLYDILSASIAPTKALDVLAVSAKAAAAGITDTGVAADAITTIINSYGYVAEDAATISDKLFTIIKKGKTTFAELGPNIGKVAATAAMAGLSFDELGATIATVTKAGIRTEMAMTTINGILKVFIKSSDDAKEAAGEFGLELNTNTLQTIGLVGVLEKLNGATAEQLALIFPEIEGLKGVAATLGDLTGHTEIYKAMLESAGATQVAFEKITGSVAFQFGQLKMEFADVTRALGLELVPIIKKDVLPIVKDLAEKLQGLVEWFGKLPDPIKKVFLALGPLLIALGGLLIVLPSLVTIAPLVGAAFHIMLGPIGLITGAIAAATAAFAYFYTTSEEFRKGIQTTGAYLEFFGRIVAEVFKTAGANIGSFLGWFSIEFPFVIRDAASATLTIFKNLGGYIGRWVSWLGQKLNPKNWLKEIEKPDWTPLLEGFEPVMASFPKIIGLNFSEASKILQQKLKEIDEGLKKTGKTVEETADKFRGVTDAIEETKRISAELWHIMEWVTDVYARGISTFIGTTKITKELRTVTAELWHTMEGVGNAYQRGISIFAGFIPEVEKLRTVTAELWHVTEGLGTVYEKGISTFKGYIPEVEKLRTVSGELWHVTEGVGNAYEKGISTYKGYIEKTEEARKVMWELYHIMEGVGRAAPTIGQKLSEAWKSFSTEVWVTFKAIALEKLGVLGEAISAFAQIIKGEVSVGAKNLGAIFANVAMGLLDSFLGLITQTDAYKKLMEILKPVIEAAIDILNAFLQPFLPIIRVLVDAFLPILEALTPIFTMLGETIADILIPILKALWPVIKMTMWTVAKFGEILAYAWMMITKIFGIPGYNAAKEMVKALGDLAGMIWDMENPFDDLTEAIEVETEARKKSTEASIAETEHKRLGTQATRDFSNKLANASDRLQTFDLGNLISPVDFGDYVSGVNLGDFVGGVNLADFIESIPHAQVGIPYVPRTMPVIVEREEAILSPLQAREWRGDNPGPNIEQNIGPITIVVEGAKVEDPVYWDGIVRNYINPAIERNAGRRAD